MSKILYIKTEGGLRGSKCCFRKKGGTVVYLKFYPYEKIRTKKLDGSGWLARPVTESRNALSVETIVQSRTGIRSNPVFTRDPVFNLCVEDILKYVNKTFDMKFTKAVLADPFYGYSPMVNGKLIPQNDFEFDECLIELKKDAWREINRLDGLAYIKEHGKNYLDVYYRKTSSEPRSTERIYVTKPISEEDFLSIFD